MADDSVVYELVGECVDDLDGATETRVRDPFVQAAGLEVLGHFMGDINECFDEFSCRFHLMSGIENVGGSTKEKFCC